MNEKQLNRIPVLEIPKETKYWVVRANGGEYYQDFLENNFIAIGDDKITKKNLDEKKKQDGFHDLDSIEILKVIYGEKYPDLKPQSHTLYSKRLYNFMFEMKKGDIIIVPSKSSNFFLIGVIDSDMFDGVSVVDDSEDTEIKPCPFIKRRKVTWIKEIGRASLPQKMFWVLSAHQTIFNVTEFSREINSLLSFIVKYGDEVTASCFVSTNEGVTIKDWHELTSVLIETTGNDSDEIDMKIDVQSPGDIAVSAAVDSITKLFQILGNIVDPSSITPGTILAYSVILCAIGFGEVNIAGFKLQGIHPYFFGKGKLEREKMKAEIEAINLNNKKISKEIEDKRIIPSDPGKIIPMKKKKDNLDLDQD
ncbi:hypothetical protein [Enterococcus gallinarum]|uniref:hypothetical protein n=1 Tax=Enterococcus gallinarum TaxID=1353 RepID=UPI001E2A57D1|nr:hypothetical protein [Enterococcus gallinarum]MCD5076665.1 hypothetical protein [Enterococcus gallinarum]